jgi:1-acyl-sn-glycerol-3-phosphate acyltransferase
MSWYRFFRAIMIPFVHAVARVEVVGRENLPKTGPFILVANHQSFLDPIIVQVICRRPLHTLAKSTQFTGKIMGWVMPRVYAIPTRRYRIEPQAVRVVLRRVAEGEGVGVYPEGERSWDAQLQPFRRGTIRLLLKAGVPVIPCGLAGSYDVWPRWSKKVRRRRVRVEFGKAIRWPAMDRREERNAFLQAATDELKETLASLSSWKHLGSAGAISEGRDGAEMLPSWLEDPVAHR